MPLKINVNISNRSLHVLIALIVVSLLVASAFAYDGIVLSLAGPFPSSIPAVGHSSEQIVINMGASTGDPCSGDVTLQSALDNDCFRVSNPFIPTCSVGEVLEADASNEWQCVPKETVEQILCGVDEYLKFDGDDWLCDSTGPCNATDACVAVTCVGESCSDSCGNIYAGTKPDGTCCIDTSWSPVTSTVCPAVTFTQTSNCGRTRSASGTSTSGSCCTDTSWSPATSTVCSGTAFTQTSNCSRTRSATGTKSCIIPGVTYLRSYNSSISGCTNLGNYTPCPSVNSGSYNCFRCTASYTFVSSYNSSIPGCINIGNYTPCPSNSSGSYNCFICPS